MSGWLKAQPQRAWRVCSGAIALAVLAACGGGGGGGSSSSSNTTNPDGVNQPASVETRSGEKIRLGGIVSKGRLVNANVFVRPVKSDGTVDESDSALLAHGTTDSSGNYTTVEEFTINGAFVVEVRARTCEAPEAEVNRDAPTCSYHVDETQGAQYLPTGFQLRAIVTATPSDNRVNVTLFSEFAIQAALKNANKLSAANMAKAQAMVNNLFGTTDLNTVVPQSLPGEDDNVTLTPAEARLSAMLAAASRVASDAESLATLGCSEVTPGSAAATLCAVNALAGNATLNSYTGTSPAITAALDTQLQEVVQDSGSAELAAVTSTTSDKLTNTSLSVPAPADTTQGLYTTIRSFFMDLVDYAKTLFNQDMGAPVFAEAHQFEDATSAAKFAGENLGRTGEVMQMGAQLYTVYQQSGRTSRVSVFYRDDGFGNMGSRSPGGRGCWLAAPNDDMIAVGAVADHVICYVDQVYNADFSTGTATGTPGETRYPAAMALHSFTLTPQLNGSAQVTGFTYSGVSLIDPSRTVVVNWSTSSPGVDELGDALSADIYSPQRTSAPITAGDPWANARTFTGTLSNLTYSNNKGYLRSLTINGDLPDLFDGSSLVPQHDTGNATTNLAKSKLENVVITAVNTTFDPTTDQPVGTAEVNFSGTLSNTTADGSTLDVAMAFTNGAMTFSNQNLDSVRFDVLTHNTSASFKANVNLVRQLNDGIQINKVQGAVYNNATASGTPFISATFTGNHDRSHYSGGLRTDSNYELVTLNLDAFVRAPNKPKIRVAFTSAVKLTTPGSPQFGLNTSDAISGDYFIYESDDSLKRDVTFTFRAPDTSNGNARVLIDIVDPTNKVAFGFGYNGNNGSNMTTTSNVDKADTWANILVNQVVHGKLDIHASPLPTVYMDNGNNFSLDTGTIHY
ncbi:MAG: hypothetical protein RI907_2546 [Pseudomonadota bacterium]